MENTVGTLLNNDLKTKHSKYDFAHDEIEAELSAHLDDAREYFVEAGLSEEEAEERRVLIQ